MDNILPYINIVDRNNFMHTGIPLISQISSCSLRIRGGNNGEALIFGFNYNLTAGLALDHRKAIATIRAAFWL